jgi:hypothetical protein
LSVCGILRPNYRLNRNQGGLDIRDSELPSLQEARYANLSRAGMVAAEARRRPRSGRSCGLRVQPYRDLQPLLDERLLCSLTEFTLACRKIDPD